jgi:gliding motility-associated-like protein
MKLLQLSFFLLIGVGHLYSQNIQKPSWSAENSKSKSFIENLGQFDQSETAATGKIHYVIDLGTTKIFFGEKGICYNFHEVIKKTKEERAQIMNQPAKSFEDHKQKERLVGKFLIKKDQVNMSWGNPNNSLEIKAFDAASDYHSYTFQNENNETENINYVKGYKYIIYKNIYPNIDLKYEIHPIIGVKYAFTVHPGADPKQIKMIYDRDVTIRNGEIVIPTMFGDIVDHAPLSFYEDNDALSIESNYELINNHVSFDVKNYDLTKTVVIDPWVQTPVFPLDWDCVWELDTDVAGNVYIIGGVDPLQLKKYNSAGVLQWSYDTPYDTTEWMGTMATDDAGNTYVTEGTAYRILKVNTAGGLVWSNNSPANGELSTEFWNISFNCDQTRLLIGGTGGNGLLPPIIKGKVYDVNMANGDIISSVDVSAPGNTFAIPPQMQEVRAMCAAPNGKYYFVTLDTIGYLNDNLSLCPGGSTSLFEKNHGVNWGYKAENWRINNTGIKVIRADANFVYTHKGNALQKRSLVDFSIIGSVTIPGGVLSTPFLSDNVTENAGIDIDNCGNIYVGSKTGVYKFNSSLVQQAFYPTTFIVYDVRVSTAGDVVACGGTGNSSSSGARSGGVQSFAASACVPIAITCCDATVCVPSAMCATGPSVTLTAATAGGTWSGTGVNASGVFNPAVSGPGIFVITYTLACGSSSISITVNTCAPLAVCAETNGTLTASNGIPTYSWQNSVLTTPCIAGFGSYCGIFTVAGAPVSTWTTFATGSNIPAPATYPIQVVDNLGTLVTYANLAAIPACVVVVCPPITFTIPAQTNVLCNGNSTGSATVLAAGGTGPYTYTWVSGSLNGPTQTNLTAGAYIINVVDANLCPGTTTVTITQPAALVAPTATVTTQPTCILTTGTITVTAPTPAAGVTYTVTGTAPVVAAQTNTTGTFSGLAPGTYSVMATVSGCNTPFTSVSVNAVPANPAAPTASVTSQPTCVTPTGILTVTAPAPAIGVTYTVTGTAPVVAAQTNATGIFSGLAPGTYSIITTLNGCISSASSLTVNAVPANPAAPTASVTAQPTCSISTGTITVIAPAPAAGISYTVTGTAPVVAAQTNSTGIFSGLATGNYTVITTVNGCVSTTTALTVNAAIGAPTAPTATITQPTCVSATGIVTVTAPVPAAGISYTLTGIAPVVAAQTNTTGIFNPLTSGNYTLIVTIAGCNSSPTSITVDIQPVTPSAPTASVIQPTCIVATGTVTVSVPTPAAGTNYTITGTLPVVASQTNTTGVFVGLASGDYSVITTVGGCTSTATLITINAQPANPVAPTSSITTLPTCAVPTATITVTAPAPAAGTTYTVTGTSPVVAAQTNISGVFSGLTVGTYDVETTVGGCTSSATVTVISAPVGAPAISLTSSTNVTCFNDNDGAAVVLGSGGTGVLTYAWTPTGGSSASATGLTAGNYTATVTDGAGCSSSLLVTIGGPTQIIITETVTDIICSSTDGQISTAVSGGSGSYSYAWTPNSETSSSITNLSAGTYGLTVTDSDGCSMSESYIVAITGSLTILATPVSTTIQEGQSVQLNATGGTTYTWTPSNGLSCTDCPDPIATPSSTTIYTVTATDVSGCTGTDNVTVIIEMVCGEVYVPTVFSPNGSGPGVNNSQCVYGTCIAQLSYAIYNRWGEKVFETTDPLVCWDGTYKEKPLNSGVFAYKLVATLLDGTTVEESGNLTLIR